MTPRPGNATVLSCPYLSCAWDHVLAPGQAIAEADTDDVCRRHLDRDHPGWSVEEVRRQLTLRQLQAVMRVGPIEMFGTQGGDP